MWLPFGTSSTKVDIGAGKDLSSLSAILLDDDYYHFLLGGRKEARGLSYVGPEHLLPLKAKAWLDLSKRKHLGEDIDNKALRKHKNDVFRLYPILNPAFSGKIPDTIKCDLREFLARMEMEIVDLKSLSLNSTTRESYWLILGGFSALTIVVEAIKNVVHGDTKRAKSRRSTSSSWAIIGTFSPDVRNRVRQPFPWGETEN